MQLTRRGRFVVAVFVATVLGASVVTHAQQRQHRMVMADTTTYTVTAHDGVPEIPFELINNHLILPVSINGSEPLRIVLDTGMPAPGMALFDGPRTQSVNLNIDPTVQVAVRGAGGDGAHQTARIAREETVTMAGLKIDGMQVIVMPPHAGFGGYHDGIIGYSLFGRFVVELDFDRSVLRLRDPGTYEPSPGSHVLPLTLRNRLPYATATITPYESEPFEAQVVVDLGASHALSLNTDESEAISVPEESLTTILGRGLSGPVEGEVGRIAMLELGGAALHDVVAVFPISEHQNPRGVDSMAGNLGSDVLRRFHSTFDYRGARLILAPNESFRERFRFDRSGLRLLPRAELVVERVLAGSPAEEAGLEVDDVVTHVDGEPVSASDYGKIVKRLQRNGQIDLSIRRGEEAFERTLTLRRLI